MLLSFFQADKERAERQREYMAQFEREASYDSSEPTSITNSSTVEGEHTIQKEGREEQGEEEVVEEEEEEEEDRTLATTPAEEEEEEQEDAMTMEEKSQVLGEFTSDDIGLLRKKLEEVIWPSLMLLCP